jgi:hypothetical protein
MDNLNQIYKFYQLREFSFQIVAFKSDHFWLKHQSYYNNRNNSIDFKGIQYGFILSEDETLYLPFIFKEDSPRIMGYILNPFISKKGIDGSGYIIDNEFIEKFNFYVRPITREEAIILLYETNVNKANFGNNNDKAMFYLNNFIFNYVS